MKPKLSVLVLIVVAVLFAGCESDRTKKPEASPHSPARAIKPQPRLTDDQLLAGAASEPVRAMDGDGWRSLFDGKSLSGWRVTDFISPGRVELRRGLLVLEVGEPFTGVNFTNEIPKVNYELSLEAMRTAGGDFFCGLTFPVRESFCSLILGGWGGSLVGLSSLDGADASENETTQFISFENGRWYRIRLRVTEQKIEAWVEQKKVVDVLTVGRNISVRFGEIERSKPFGLSSWMTSAAYREIKLRGVTGPVDPVKE